ncbi:MAG: InlB B-repeat-containing protein, partial [Coriobacteriales bacterium]|nr:InlB B-repeat-containing protein [Coriobacteriales bacterium]
MKRETAKGHEARKISPRRMPRSGGKTRLLPRIVEKSVMITLAVLLVFGLFPLFVFATDPIGTPSVGIPPILNIDGSDEGSSGSGTGGGEGSGQENPNGSQPGTGSEEGAGGGTGEGTGEGGTGGGAGAGGEEFPTPGLGSGELNPLATTWVVSYVYPSGSPATETVVEGDPAPYKSVNPALYGKLRFRGWFTVANPDNTTKPYDFGTPITGNLTLYAAFADTYLISYLDQADTVIHTVELAPNARIYSPSNKDVFDKITAPGSGQRLIGFYDRDDVNTPPVLIDFNYATASKNLYLKPYFSQNYYVLFFSEGTQVDPQLVAYGNKALQPANPTRPGYTFNGWYLEGASMPFNFNTAVTEDITLTARFTPSTANYTIALWMEKPNLYLPGAEPTPGNLSDYNYIGSVNYIDSVRISGTTGTTTNVTSASLGSLWTTDGMLKYAEFQSAGNKVINGNGTTVVNLYAKRKVYTYTFNLGTTTGRSMKIGGITYNSGYGQTQYEMKVKYGMEILTKFPAQANDPTYVQFNGGTGMIFSYWGKDFTGSGIYSTSGIATRWFAADEAVLPGDGNNSNKLQFTAVWADPSTTYNYRYMIEALPGQVVTTTNSAVYNSKTYIVKEELNERYQIDPVNFPIVAKTIDGLTALKQNWYNTDTTRTLEYWPYTYSESKGYERIVAQVSPPGGPIDPANYNCFFYDRIRYNLEYNLVVGDGEPPVTNSSLFATKTLMFEESFAGYEPATTPARPGYSFLGWYRDADYMVPFDWNGSMPVGGSIAYAKWQANDHLVRFFDFKGGPLMATKWAANGGYVTDSSPVPSYMVGQFYPGRGIYLGWGYDMAVSVPAPFYFSIPIFQDYDVYALWRTTGLHVSYNLDGGIGATPFDGNE